jgi:hypothetical protein
VLLKIRGVQLETHEPHGSGKSVLCCLLEEPYVSINVTKFVSTLSEIWRNFCRRKKVLADVIAKHSV